MKEQPANPLEAAPAQPETAEEREKRAQQYEQENVGPEEWREQE